MKTTLERRQVVAKAMTKLRVYRKNNRLCRECGEPLEEKDKTRCFNCKTRHAAKTAVLYHRRKEAVDASK